MTTTAPRLIRMPEVSSMTGLSKTSIYRRIAGGDFPQQIPLGSRLVVCNELEVQKWINKQLPSKK